MVIGVLIWSAVLAQSSEALLSSVNVGMGDRISMSISCDNLSVETLNHNSLALLRGLYEFPFEIITVPF